MYSEENLEESTLNSWRKFYNPGREEVLKLNLYSPEQKNQKDQYKSEKKNIGTDLVKLHSSIERVKKFLPGVVNLITQSTKDEKEEKIVYQRLEHIEKENNLKEQISNLDNQINEGKILRNLKAEELIKLESQIGDIELDINMISDVSRYTMIEKERNDLLNELHTYKENMKIIKRKEREKEKEKQLKNEGNNNNTNNNDNNNNNKDDKNDNNNNTTSNFNEDDNNTISQFFRGTKIKITDEQQLEVMFLRASQSRSKKLKEYKLKLPPLIKRKNKILTEIKEINEKKKYKRR